MLGALFGFRGRLSRPGFWEVVMSIVLIDIALVIGRMYVADSGLPGGLAPSSQLSQVLMGLVPWVLVIFTIWSLLAAAIKRCHDRGRTGALVLVGLIPLIGWLWLAIDLFVLEGTEGRNRYGKVPHGPDPAERARFDWSAEPAAAEPAPAPVPAAGRLMMDPEPALAHHAPPPEAPAHLAPEPPADVQEVRAEAIGHEAPRDDAPMPVRESVEEPPAPHPEPMPELVQHHEEAPAKEPYDPLTAPLVIGVR